MKNSWQDEDAARMVAHYREQGVSADVARRVHTSRLLGSEQALVPQGGGKGSGCAPRPRAAGW